MEYIDEEGKNNAKGVSKDETQENANENTAKPNATEPFRGRRDSTSMLLTAALGDFDNINSLRQSRLSLSMFDEDPSVRESLRTFSNTNPENSGSTAGQLLSRSHPLDSSIPEGSCDGDLGNKSFLLNQEARTRRFSNKNMMRRSSFLRDSIDLNAELMMGPFTNKSSKETTGEPKVHHNEDDFLKFNIPELNKNLPASVSPYMGPSQHKPSLAFSNRKFSFGGLMSAQKDSISGDGAMDSFLGLNGKDDDIFLAQRRNSSLSIMMRPNIIGMDKYKSFQNENAISDGDEDDYVDSKNEDINTHNQTPTTSLGKSLNKATPAVRSLSQQMVLSNEATGGKYGAPTLTTPVMLIKNQHPPSTLNPSSVKDNTILESTKKVSMPNTLHPPDSDISAYARLDFADSTFYVQTLKVTLGRKPNTNDPSQTGVVTAQQVNDSNKDNVDVNLGSSKNISRKHAQIYYNFANEKFEMTVLGKNGAFVNDEFIGKNVTVGLSNDTKIQIANIPFIFVQDASSISEYGNTDRFKTKEEIDNENNIKRENEIKALNEKKKESLKKKREEKAALEMLAKQQQLHIKGQKQQQEKLDQQKEKSMKKSIQSTMTVLTPKETTPKRFKKKEYLPEEIPLEYREKPNIPYNTMILNVFKKFTKADGQTMSLSNIYDVMKELYPYYEYCSKGWQSSVRHALQTNKTFTRGPKEGKSWLWMVDTNYLKEKELEEKRLIEEKKKAEEANREAKRKFFQRLPQAVNHKESQDAKQKRTLIYLQKQLMILTTDRQGLDKETISQVLTKALASTIQKVNEVSKKIGMTKHPLGFLMDKNPQQLNFILAAACNASLKDVTGGTYSQIVKLPTPQELARDLDEAKKDYFATTGKVWEQPKDIKPPIKKLTLKQQRLKEAQLKADAAEAALKKAQELKLVAASNSNKGILESKSSEIKKEDSFSKVKDDNVKRIDLTRERESEKYDSERKSIPSFVTMKKNSSNESLANSSGKLAVKSESPVAISALVSENPNRESIKRKAESEPETSIKKAKVDPKGSIGKNIKKPIGPTTTIINLQPNMKNTSVSYSGEQITTTGTLSKKPVFASAKKTSTAVKSNVYRPSSVNFDPSSLSKFFQAKNQARSANTNSSKSAPNEPLPPKPVPAVKKEVLKDEVESSDEDTSSSDGESDSSDGSDSSDDDDDDDDSSDDDSSDDDDKSKQILEPEKPLTQVKETVTENAGNEIPETKKTVVEEESKKNPPANEPIAVEETLDSGAAKEPTQSVI